MTEFGRRPVTVEDVYAIRTAGDAQISPDGSRVAYVVSWAEREKDTNRSQIYVAPADGSAPGEAWTHGQSNASGPRWSPDGRKLAFISNRENPDKSDAYIMPAAGGEARKLSCPPGSVQAIVWSPDSTRVALLVRVDPGLQTENPEERKRLENRPRVVTAIKYKGDGRGYIGGKRNQIFVATVDSAEDAVQLTRGDWDDSPPSWSPDGTYLCFASARHATRDEDQHVDIFTLSAEGGEPNRLAREEGPAAAPSWSPDGKQIAFFGNTHKTEFGGMKNLHLWVIGLKDDHTAGETRDVTPDLDRSAVAGVPPFPTLAPIWSEDSRKITFGALDQGNAHLYTVPVSGGKPEKIAGGERTILSYSAGGGKLAMTISAPDMPGDVWVCDADGGNMRRITDLNQDFFQKVEISLPEHLTFKGEDGGEYEGWVLKPVGLREGERYPLVLDVHGGPHGAYGNSFPVLYWHMLTGRGYGVLAINPRGSGGYGEDFASYIKGAWGIRDFPDFMSAVDAVIKQGWVDPEKLGVTGYSYGGYMTNWIAGHTDRFKAAVSGGCVSDLISFFGTSDIGAPFFENEIGGRPDEMRQKYIELSPVTYVDKITTPMLLMHGEADDRCPIGQSEEMFVGLRRLGKPVEFVRYPGSSHLMFRIGPPSHRVDYFSRLVDWFDRYIRPDSYGA